MPVGIMGSRQTIILDNMILKLKGTTCNFIKVLKLSFKSIIEEASGMPSIFSYFIKPKTHSQSGFYHFQFHVTRPGFEPRQAESESDVLPLHYRAIFYEPQI